MTSFDDLKAKALDLAQAGAAKAKELTELRCEQAPRRR